MSGCGVARLTPDAQMQKTPECRQMQDKLAVDKSLTAAQAAEKAGCGSRFPGPLLSIRARPVRPLCKPPMLWRSSAPARGFIEPCLPTLGHTVPSGPQRVTRSNTTATGLCAVETAMHPCASLSVYYRPDFTEPFGDTHGAFCGRPRGGEGGRRRALNWF